MLVQVFSDFMKLWQVILQKLDRFLVLCFYKVDGQGIDLAGKGKTAILRLFYKKRRKK